MVNPLASRFNCDAALVDPRSSARVESYLATAWDALRTETSKRELAIEMSASDDEDGFWSEDWSWLRPYNVVDGVLQIPVKGVLLSGFPYQLWDWATGYEYIMAAYQRGMADPNVKGLAFVIDSPGGEVEGNFDLVDFMSGDAKVKPVQAFAVAAYSAAYSIASAADKITVTRTGGVGSIGVVTSHVDMSKALDDWGYKITFIFAGKHKVDGNPYEPLPDDVKARIQTTVDKLYGMFVGIVARNRGMEEQAVRDTEALTFLSDDALQIGLADAVGPLVDSIAAFAAELNSQGDFSMTTQTKTVAEGSTETFTAADLATARAEGVTEGSKATATRISAILKSPEAEGKTASAMQMAFETEMTAEQAIGLLKTIPAASAFTDTKGGKSHFEAAMEQTDPGVTAGGEKQKATAAEEILGDFRAAGGRTRNAA